MRRYCVHVLNHASCRYDRLNQMYMNMDSALHLLRVLYILVYVRVCMCFETFYECVCSDLYICIKTAVIQM